jgi:predicted MFS family arabinose efflux permease
MITPLPGAHALKPGAASFPMFGVVPALVDGEGARAGRRGRRQPGITDSWPGQMRTVYGDHDRFIQTYFTTYPGKYFTGDGCRRDADGYYWITGRVDDVINVSGHRMGTAEVESALVAHPKVAEAAVVGYPHDIKGQGIYAYVTTMDGVRTATSCALNWSSGCARKSARSPRPTWSSSPPPAQDPFRARSCAASCARSPRTIRGQPWRYLDAGRSGVVDDVAIGAVLWTTAVAGTFRLGQGTAIGITLAGATAAHAIVPPLTVWLITDFGWRLAFVLLGGGIGILAFVLCYFFFFDQRDRARIRSRSTGDPAIASGLELPGLTLAQAARSRALWLIGASIFIIMALTIGFLVHQIEILRGVGISRTNAAWLAGLSGAMGIVGKLVTGVLLDRYRGNLVGGITMAAAALAFVLLLFDSTLMGLVVFAMLVNGYTAGAKLQIASYLTVRYAGMRNFGKIYGMISCLVGLGAAAGPLVAGMIYDTFASYGAFLTAGAVGLGFAAVCLFVLPGYPDWEKERPPSPA